MYKLDLRDVSLETSTAYLEAASLDLSNATKHVSA